VWDAQGTEGIVGVVLVTLPDGRVFFPGRCQHDILYQPLAAMFGSDVDTVLRTVPGLLGDDLRAALRVEEPPPAGEEVMILNPQDAPADLLASLRTAGVHFKLSKPLGEAYGIATRIAAGWNEGFNASMPGVATGVAIGAYLDEGPLEVWLLDAGGDVRATPWRCWGR
jgi:hypothetical protein